MKRTKLSDRQLPDYTAGEECMNMITHIVGGGVAVLALIGCCWVSILHQTLLGILCAVIYGFSMVALYCMSSIYHGLRPGIGKKVLQVLDHCTIYFLIGGTYTPVVLCSIREVSPAWAWTIFGIVWGCAIFGSVFTAIDLKKYRVLSMICYLGMGWCVVIAAKPTVMAVPKMGLLWLLLGGIAYTLGAILYGLGKKIRYMHSVFHLFVLAGSVMQYVTIIGYVL